MGLKLKKMVKICFKYWFKSWPIIRVYELEQGINSHLHGFESLNQYNLKMSIRKDIILDLLKVLCNTIVFCYFIEI